MKPFDIDLTPPVFNDPAATIAMAAYTAKLRSILEFIADNLQVVTVVDTAPTVEELHTTGDNKGNTLSEIMILNTSTQSSRRIYYKDIAGNLRYLESD